jgi:hypothetical protein
MGPCGRYLSQFVDFSRFDAMPPAGNMICMANLKGSMQLMPYCVGMPEVCINAARETTMRTKRKFLIPLIGVLCTVLTGTRHNLEASVVVSSPTHTVDPISAPLKRVLKN